jgi:hypothetical protein
MARRWMAVVMAPAILAAATASSDALTSALQQAGPGQQQTWPGAAQSE